MTINQAVQSKITWSIIWGGMIALPVYGIEVIRIFFTFYLILQLFDFATWYLSARKLSLVTSQIWINGAIKKILLVCLLTLVLISVWGLKTTWIIDNDYIWLLPLWLLGVFIFFEIVSIFENLAVTFWDSREWKLFNTLAYLSNLLFNMSIDKLKSMTENKIQDKFNK